MHAVLIHRKIRCALCLLRSKRADPKQMSARCNSAWPMCCSCRKQKGAKGLSCITPQSGSQDNGVKLYAVPGYHIRSSV